MKLSGLLEKLAEKYEDPEFDKAIGLAIELEDPEAEGDELDDMMGEEDMDMDMEMEMGMEEDEMGMEDDMLLPEGEDDGLAELDIMMGKKKKKK